VGEFLPAATKLAEAGLAVVVILILIGSRLRIWRWNQDFIDLETRHAQERTRLEADRDWWRSQVIKKFGLHDRPRR
jgi:hypothetical protein